MVVEKNVRKTERFFDNRYKIRFFILLSIRNPQSEIRNSYISFLLQMQHDFLGGFIRCDVGSIYPDFG